MAQNQQREAERRTESSPRPDQRVRATETTAPSAGRGRNGGGRIAVLVAHGYEKVELDEPVRVLEEAGFEPVVVSPEEGRVNAWEKDHWEGGVDVDQPLAGADAGSFAGLLLPGGVINPDRLRMNDQAVRFVRAFFEAGKPVAAICHGPWTMIDAGVVEGRRLTSWPSLKNDLKNAGAKWVDEEVVVDHGLVTSRKPEDLEAFTAKMVEEYREGVHRLQAVSA